jgi:hypothetical protein
VSLRQLICALRGHEEYLRFEKNRVYLECVSCGYESPGWTTERPISVHPFRARESSSSSGKPLLRKVA